MMEIILTFNFLFIEENALIYFPSLTDVIVVDLWVLWYLGSSGYLAEAEVVSKG